MKEPSRQSIRRTLDLLSSYFIVKEGQANKGEFSHEQIDIWRQEVDDTVEYLNWLAYRNEDWYKDRMPRILALKERLKKEEGGEINDNSSSGT